MKAFKNKKNILLLGRLKKKIYKRKNKYLILSIALLCKLRPTIAKGLALCHPTSWQWSWNHSPGLLPSRLLLSAEIVHLNHLKKWVSGFPHSSVGKESACNAGNRGSIPGSERSPGEGIGHPLQYSWVSLVAQLVKNPPAMWETWVWSLGWEDPLEKGKSTHSSILAWRSPWTV